MDRHFAGNIQLAACCQHGSAGTLLKRSVTSFSFLSDLKNKHVLNDHEKSKKQFLTNNPNVRRGENYLLPFSFQRIWFRFMHLL